VWPLPECKFQSLLVGSLFPFQKGPVVFSHGHIFGPEMAVAVTSADSLRNKFHYVVDLIVKKTVNLRVITERLAALSRNSFLFA
jgi:hypothetical protein